MDMKVKYRSANCLELCSTHCQEVCKSLWSLQQSNQLCDIFLTAGDEVIFAHRSVLAASSPFFCKKDSDPDNTETVLKIHVLETTSEVVNDVVRYLYTGFMVLNKDNIDEVESLCKKWQVQSALKLCQKFKSDSEKFKKDKEKIKKDNAKHKRGSDPINNGSRIRSRKRVRQTEVGEDLQTEISEKLPRVESLHSIKPTSDNVISCEAEKTTPDTLTDTTKPPGSINTDDTVKRETLESFEETTYDESPQGGSDYLPIEQIDTSSSNTTKNSNSNAYRPLKMKRTTVKNLKTVQSSSDCLITQSNGSKPTAEVIDKTDCQKERVTQRAIPNSSPTHLPQSRQSEQGAVKKPMKCGHCCKLLSSLEALAKHKLKCKACPKCRQVFKTHQKCIGHILANSCKKLVVEKFKCVECSKLFSKESTRDNHIKKCHQTEQTTEPSIQICKVDGCNFQTQLQRNLHKHVKYTHSENKHVMCDTCGAMSKNEYYLRIHQRARHADAISCDICGLRVKTRQVLKSHKMRQHGQGTPEYLCSQCTYITYTKTELDKHMFHRHKVPLPSGNEGYTCPHCQWQCIQKTSMEQHILRHTAKERNFPCRLCNKRFITSNDLKGHMVSHDPDRKKFKCPHCDYCTAYGRFKLRDHVSRIHENKDYKPWVCELCNYRTNVKGNLTSHLRKTHKLNVDTNQHLINKVEPFNAANADLKTPAGTKGTAGGKQKRPAEGGSSQGEEDRVAVQPLIVTPLRPLSDTTPDNQTAGEGVTPATGSSGSDQVFCVSAGLFSSSGSTVAPGGTLPSTLLTESPSLDAAPRTEHLPMLSGPYVGHPGQQQMQSQSHPHSQSPPQSQPQSHLHTLSQLQQQPHLIAQAPLPITIAPIQPSRVIVPGHDSPSNQSMYMDIW